MALRWSSLIGTFCNFNSYVNYSSSCQLSKNLSKTIKENFPGSYAIIAWDHVFLMNGSTKSELLTQKSENIWLSLKKKEMQIIQQLVIFVLCEFCCRKLSFSILWVAGLFMTIIMTWVLLDPIDFDVNYNGFMQFLHSNFVEMYLMRLPAHTLVYVCYTFFINMLKRKKTNKS
jgi:hypothetical protein